MKIETKQFKKGTKEPEEFEIKKEKVSAPSKRKKEDDIDGKNTK